MKTVEAVLDAVYGGDQKEAAKSIGVMPNAPWNWVKSGHFSARAAIKIAADAKEKGLDLPIEEIPVLDNKEAAE